MSSGSFEGSFSRDVALTAMVVATERLVYAKLSAEQDEAVLHILSGQDVFVSLPTGAGNSVLPHFPTFFVAVVPVLAS